MLMYSKARVKIVFFIKRFLFVIDLGLGAEVSIHGSGNRNSYII